MNAQELLERLNLLDENERIEAKQAREIGKSVLETVCAFANEPGLGGGWILLGTKISLSGNQGSLSSNLDALYSNQSGLSSNPDDLSSNPDGSALLDTTERRALLNELPGELAARVGALGQRRPPEEVRELVVALCKQRVFRVEELAILLARNPETVRQNYLRPLLRAGRITMIRPNVPNDPEQAYRTVGVRE